MQETPMIARLGLPLLFALLLALAIQLLRQLRRG